MLKKTMMRKVMALTMLLILATSTFTPGVAYALTAGPTSPEATSFEPVDTTDMVNLNTGSFTYNLPLLEVPGPEGGYPLSLSYHAGIQPDLDASWVGLGWTLNPGAINRNVNGTPDDWNGVDGTVRDYWSGGQQWTGTLGVGLGYDVASVSAGLTFGNDTYRGFGVGGYVGVSAGLGLSPVSVGATVGVSPWGDPYGNLGLSIGAELGSSVSGSIGLGVSTNFKTIDASLNGGVGWGAVDKDANTNNGLRNTTGGSILGASIGSNTGKPSLDVGGIGASISNSNAGNISTSSSGLTVNIPVWYGVNVTLGYNKQRYWTDARTDFKSFGSYLDYNPDGLITPYTSGETFIGYNRIYDSYSLLEGGDHNIIDNPDPKMQQGGSFPETDRYDVLAQGVSGSIRPYNFQHRLYQQSWVNRTNPYPQISIHYNGVDNAINNQPYFRFDNDFSNSYQQTDFNSTAADNYANSGYPYESYSNPTFDSNPKYGNDDGTFGFGGGNKLAGSKSVKVGSSILPSRIDQPSSKLFLGTVPSGISGFEITNASGVTYHFALPAYANEEESYQASKNNKSNSFNRLTKSKAYAYTWHLTSITGPDFVDRNNNQKADEGDWGYYVNFEYGLWNENYIWRNPAEGFNKDDDPAFDRLAMGQKEIYYLNAIKTRTHTALFEKEERLDGKGVSAVVKIISRWDNRSYLFPNGRFDNTSQSVMRLNKVYLFNNNDLPNINYAQSGAGGSSGYTTVTVNDPAPFQLPERQIQVPNYSPRKENVLDNNDLNSNRAAIEAKALRVIDFNYNYSLCAGASNSFNKSNPPLKYGKLALTSIKTRGKAGADLLPATSFDYNLSEDQVKKAASVSIGISSFTSSSNFEIGDLIETDEANPRYLGVITGKSGNTYSIQNNSQTSAIVANIRTTKNPPYNRYAYDLWQMYKSNVRADLVESNVNRYGKGDDISARSVDAWSLRTVTGPYGEKVRVNYESNTFSNVLINESFPYIANMTVTQWENNKIKKAQLSIDNAGGNIADLIDQDGVGRLVAMLKYTGNANVANRYNAIYAEFTVEGFVSANTINVIIKDYSQGDVATVTKKRSWIRRALNTLLGIPLIAGSTEYQGCLTANVSFIKKQKPYEYGGGIRVKDITLETDESKQTTSYNYDDLSDSKLSSGVTTYTPTTLPVYNESVFSSSNLGEIAKEYKKMLFRNVDELYAYARLLPPPGVYYEHVTVSNSVINKADGVQRNKEGRTRYQFEVPGMYSVNRQTVVNKDWNTQISPTLTALPVKEKHIIFRNFTSAIGNLKSTTTLDNNGKKLTESINNYLHDGLLNEDEVRFFETYKQRLEQFKYQGLLVERNFEAKHIDDAMDGENIIRQVTYTMKETYPCIPLGTTTINYVNGTKTVAQNLAFDFYSGAVTKTLNIDASGNRSVAEKVPAYRVYDEMGLKGLSADKKNMLTQTAAGYAYTVDAGNNKIGLVSASVNTWGTDVNVLTPGYDVIQQDGSGSYNGYPKGRVWRPKMNYTWAPEGSSQNGITSIGLFVDFSWSNQDDPAAQNSGWIRSGQATLYDVFSHALEASDINDQFAATKMGYNHSRVMVTGGPAKYAELAYSGAEDENVGSVFNGDIKLGGASINNNPAYAHTGSRSMQLTNGTGFQYEVPISKLDNTRDYWASVWVKPASGSIVNAGIFYNNGAGQVNGTLSAPNPSGWQLATILIPATAINGSALTVGGYSNSNTVYLDDFRFHPLNAGISSYVYDKLTGELTYILDNNNIATKFEYDGVGRLVRTQKETLPLGFKPMAEMLYNYGRTIYSSDAIINQVFVKNDCVGSNVAGSEVNITVPQGQFTSFNSKAEANQAAYNYAQQQANSLGTCNNVYVTIQTINTYNYSGYNYTETYGDVVLRTYSDAACTVPYYGDVSLTLVEWENSYGVDGGMNCDGGNYDLYNNHSLTFSGGEYYFATGKLVYHAKLHPVVYDIQCEVSWNFSVQ